VVRFRCHENPLGGDDPKFFMKVVRAAFSQRRKTLRNSLTKSGNFGAPKEAVLEAMEVAGVDPGRRPQSLDLREFQSLAREIRARI